MEHGENRRKEMESLELRKTPFKQTGPVFYFYNQGMERHKWEGFRKHGLHPEDPRRLTVIMEALGANGFLERMEQVITNRKLRRDEAELIHGRDMWGRLEKYCEKSVEEMFQWNKTTGDNYKSLYLHPTSFDCAKIAVGGILEMIDVIVKGGGAGMAIVRPPGSGFNILFKLSFISYFIEILINKHCPY